MHRKRRVLWSVLRFKLFISKLQVRHIISGRLFALKMIKKSYVNDCRRLEQVLRERKILSEILNDSKYATYKYKHIVDSLYHFMPRLLQGITCRSWWNSRREGNFSFTSRIRTLMNSKLNYIFVRCCRRWNRSTRTRYSTGTLRFIKLYIIIIAWKHLDWFERSCFPHRLRSIQTWIVEWAADLQFLWFSWVYAPWNHRVYNPYNQYRREGYTYSADFYSLGCLLFELLFGIPPLYSEDTQEILKNKCSQDIQYPPDLSTEKLEILMSLLHKIP